MRENLGTDRHSGLLRKVPLVLSVFLLAGCTHLVAVAGPGKTYDEFAKDRYDCIKECSHRTWDFSANPYNAGAWGGEQVNETQFFACMEARGHRTVRQ